MHGYEVKMTLARWSMDWWADIQSGSIYAGLRKLEQDGLAEIASTSREGNRPERRVYRITAAGRHEFVRLLKQSWLSITRFSRPIDLAVSFYDELERHEILELLNIRVNHLTGLAHAFEPSNMPPMASDAQHAVVTDLRDHERRLIAAEIEWTRSLMRRLEGSDYPASYGTKGKARERARTKRTSART